jgi:hypothetical protein
MGWIAAGIVVAGALVMAGMIVISTSLDRIARELGKS